MKFWIGVGVLKPSGDDFRQIILSPGQQKNATFSFEPVSISVLQGKGFKKVRVLK